MKVKFIKPTGSFAEWEDKGSVHLIGEGDTTACGIPDENWQTKPTKAPLTCSSCISMLKWAKKVAGIEK